MEKEFGFGVIAPDFATLSRFKTDVQSIGWKYLDDFTEWSEKEFEDYKCLWFDKEWEEAKYPEELCFSLSNPDGNVLYINSAEEYEKALQHAKDVFFNTQTFYYISEKITDNDGVFDYATGNKEITVYRIVDNVPVVFKGISCLNEDNSEEMIKEALEEDGIYDCKLIRL